MLKFILLLVVLIKFDLFAQMTANDFHIIEQKDSLYYLLTDNALYKFYSHESSGDFYLTNKLECYYTAAARMMLNDEYLFIYYVDSAFYYRNDDPRDITFENILEPGYTITSMHGFGPYFFIRSGNTYHLLKIENGVVITVEDSLFNHPPQMLVHFAYPYVVVGFDVYKYVEGFDFYSIGPIGCGNTKTGISGDTLICHFYWVPPNPPLICNLYKIVIKEPEFEHYIFYNWGINVPQIHNLIGHLRPRRNLYLFTVANIILTPSAQVAYHAQPSDRAAITDFYIFLLGGDTLKFSKWHNGAAFYPFNYIDATNVKSEERISISFNLHQNYPNPFNPSTVISWQSPVHSHQTLKVYDMLGREVATLVDEERPAGKYEVTFDATGLASGVYVYELRAGNFFQRNKMMYLK